MKLIMYNAYYIINIVREKWQGGLHEWKHSNIEGIVGNKCEEYEWNKGVSDGRDTMACEGEISDKHGVRTCLPFRILIEAFVRWFGPEEAWMEPT